MAQLNISLPLEDLDRIRAAAREEGIAISHYVRLKVLDQATGPWVPGSDDRLDGIEGRLERLERLADQAGG